MKKSMRQTERQREYFMNRLVITMGDPCGIGSEIVVKFFDEIYRIEEKNLFIAVIGSRKIIEKEMLKQRADFEIVEITRESQIKDLKLEKNKMHLINIDIEEEIEMGKSTEIGGKMSIAYLDKAIDLCRKKIFDGMVTCPISKDSINMAGYKYSGHTTYLADKTGSDNFAMVLKGNKITVILNTTHLSIIDAAKKVKKENIIKKIRLAEQAKEELSLNGKIAVAGLNPHNGENGLFGDEEIKEIIPAVKEAKEAGIDVEGPVVPDTLFVKMLRGDYSLAVVMYHDQGLIPMKMESFGMGVNITIGLPFVRTSVDHGTAFDIVGKDLANPGSLKEAVKIAAVNVKNRKNKLENYAEVDYSE